MHGNLHVIRADDGVHCRGEVSYLEHEIDSLKRTVDGERKKADDLIRERDLLNKLKTQAEHATHKQIDLIKINENTKRNLEQEMNGYKIEAQKQAKVSLVCCTPATELFVVHHKLHFG